MGSLVDIRDIRDVFFSFTANCGTDIIISYFAREIYLICTQYLCKNW